MKLANQGAKEKLKQKLSENYAQKTRLHCINCFHLLCIAMQLNI